MTDVFMEWKEIMSSGKKTSQRKEGDLDEANQLNLFFNRFDVAFAPPHDMIPTPLGTLTS